MIDDYSVKILRNMTGEQRLWIASKINEEARALLNSYINYKNPDWDEKQIIKEIVKFLYDIDLDKMRLANGRGDKEKDD